VKTISVNVTQADVDQGQRLNARKFPVALAVKRAASLKNADVVFVVETTRSTPSNPEFAAMIWLDSKPSYHSRINIDLPDSVNRWIADINDAGINTPAPFSFQLEVPDVLLEDNPVETFE
jgi:hypothetical protein